MLILENQYKRAPCVGLFSSIILSGVRAQKRRDDPGALTSSREIKWVFP